MTATGFSTDDTTHRSALSELLADGQWHTQAEMQAVGGYRYGARLLELRRAGQMIVTVKVGQGVYRYRRLGFVEIRPKSKKRPTRAQLEAIAEDAAAYLLISTSPAARHRLGDALVAAGYLPEGD